MIIIMIMIINSEIEMIGKYWPPATGNEMSSQCLLETGDNDGHKEEPKNRRIRSESEEKHNFWEKNKLFIE